MGVLFALAFKRYDNQSIGGGTMSNIIEQKKQVVTELADKFRNSKSAVLVDYRGLDVAEVTELRSATS